MSYAAVLAGLLLSLHHVDAFVTQSSCIRSTTAAGTSRRQHDTCPPPASRRGAAVSATPVAKPTRRRHTYHRMLVSGTPGDSGESAGEPEDGGIEEERSIPEGTDTIPTSSAGDSLVEDTTPIQGNEAAVEAVTNEDATAAASEGVVPAKKNAAEEETGGGDAAEETEDDGEPLFLPSGDNKDFRLFRAKLRAGSDEKWQEQLKRNVNEAQLGGQDAWAHELSTPENGCLIIAKSGAFNMAQSYFNEVSFSS